jgi:Uma2 family endonuclease
MLSEYSVPEASEVTLNAPILPFTGSMDVDEFMAFVETRPGKEHWELIEGVAVLMTPASIAQSRIGHNLSELLNHAFEARRLDFFAYIGTAVRVENNRHFQAQPDVVVVPGVASYDLHSEKFQLAGEIMSSTNTRQEIDLKLRRYREGPDNLYVVVIEPSEFLVGIHARRESWQPKVLKQPNDIVEMPEFGLRCCVVEIYRGTPLDPQRSGS